MEGQGKIFIVDDNEDVLFALNLLLQPYVEKIKVATDPSRIEHFMRTFEPDVILLDMNFSRDAISGQEGFDCLEQILGIDPEAVVLFMTAYADTEKAVRAIKAGATDFISKPWEKEKLLATLSSAVKLRQSRREVKLLKDRVEMLSDQEKGVPLMIGQSKVMQEVFTTIRRLSETDANILILGENGTGKDLVARSLRFFSPRQHADFVTIDLGSVPESLFESELFGYEKGAFTDARKAKAGRLEVASGGTLFLDEIGNLSLSMQSKLLTAIEKRRISRLGATKSIPIDVRLICATNADIRQMVEEGTFRQYLLYRINTIEIHIPPLRERGDDIVLLAEHFLQKYAHKYKKEIQGLSREAKQKLLRYSWPGNVRELKNTIIYMNAMRDGDVLGLSDLPERPERKENGITELQNAVLKPAKDAETADNQLLELIRELLKEDILLGRRILLDEAKKRGICSSEYQLRKLLASLEQSGYILMGKGKVGIQLK
jgi:DNA-binding NtrC family response regulator